MIHGVFARSPRAVLVASSLWPWPPQVAIWSHFTPLNHEPTPHLDRSARMPLRSGGARGHLDQRRHGNGVEVRAGDALSTLPLTCEGAAEPC